MGNGQNKESKEAPPHSANKPRTSVDESASARRGSIARLEQGFKAHTEITEKTTLTKQDFADQVFVAIPVVGKRIHKYLVSLQPGEQTRNVVDRAVYAHGGSKLLGLLSDGDQVKFYIQLFAKGKNLVAIKDMVELLSVSEQASWLSAGIVLRPTPDSRQCFEKRLKTLFRENSALSLADVVNWSCKHCPKMTANLHGYVISCLMDTTDVFIGKAEEPSGVVKKCKDGQSLLNLSSIWLLTCVLPPKYFPIPASSSVVLLSNVANIVQNNTWHSIYDSNSQGLSVNRFQHHIMNYFGPTILFLSFDQFVYAVAVDLPWTENNQRWGDVDGMFFQINPEYRLIQSGAGLIYFNLSDRTAPKGLHVGKDSRTTFLKMNDEMTTVSHYSVDYKLTAIEVWGCGGEEILSKQHAQHQWENKEVSKSQNRKLVPDDWRDNPDKAILELGGVSTEHNERADI